MYVENTSLQTLIIYFDVMHEITLSFCLRALICTVQSR